jgi:HEAT repeat protein
MRRVWTGWGRKFVVGALAAILLAGAWVTWLERTPLLAWYYVRGLAGSGEAERDTWIARIAQLEEAAVPELVGCFRRKDAQACANARLALVHLAARWSADDSRRAALADMLAEGFSVRSLPGQLNSLELARALVEASQAGGAPSNGDLQMGAHLASEAARMPDRQVHAQALALGELLMTSGGCPEVRGAARELVQACLHDGEPHNQIRAVRLAQRPEINLLDQVVPLLRDPAPEVRRAALLAVGDAPAVVATDDLLQWLHDPDVEVRRLCEEALRLARHLPEKHVRLGRLLTDQHAEVRLQVLECLRRDPDLEPGVWLRRLSHDPAAAVRAAAARAVATQGLAALTDRLGQMAQNDPSPTVRQLARYYLSRPTLIRPQLAAQ